MPTPVLASDIIDLANGTLSNYDTGKIQQIAQSKVDYPLLRSMFLGDGDENKGSRWYNTDGGKDIVRQLQYRVNDTARHVGFYEDDVIEIQDVTTTLTVKWAMATNNWGFQRQEFIHNKGKARIFDLMLPRRTNCLLALMEQISTLLWTLPAASGDDLKNPLGVPYWVVKGTNGQEGHVGGAPSGHSTVAGVNLTTVPTYKNYFADYVAATKQDLIKKMRAGWRATGFRSPVEVSEHTVGPAGQYKYYANADSCEAFEDIGEAQNENLGRDVAPYQVPSTRSGVSYSAGDAIMFRKRPICYEPELDSDTGNPVYGIDHSCFKVAIAEGENFRKHPVEKHPTKHNVFIQHVDVMYQLLCVDRRRQQVYAIVP